MTVLDLWKLHLQCSRARANGVPSVMAEALRECERVMGAELTRILTPLTKDEPEPDPQDA